MKVCEGYLLFRCVAEGEAEGFYNLLYICFSEGANGRFHFWRERGGLQKWYILLLKQSFCFTEKDRKLSQKDNNETIEPYVDYYYLWKAKVWV